MSRSAPRRRAMRPPRRPRATLLALLALALALTSLTACGSPDPFVGTWRVRSLPDYALVVVKLDQGYYATIVQDDEPAGWLPYKRSGDELSRDMSTDGGEQVWRLVAAGEDALVLKVSGSRDVVFARSNTTLAVPGPSPGDL
jgi:hypothetical protein